MMEAAASAAFSLHWWALCGGLQLPLAPFNSNLLRVAPNSSPEDASRDMKVQCLEEAGTGLTTGSIDEVEI